METLPKSAWPQAQSSLITGYKVVEASTSTPSPLCTEDDAGRSGWGLNHIRLGRAPPTSPHQAAGPARLGAHHGPTAGPYQGGAGHPPRPRGLPGLLPQPREVPTPGSSANIPHPDVWTPAQGLQGPLNRLHLPFFLCGEGQTMNPSPVS